MTNPVEKLSPSAACPTGNTVLAKHQCDERRVGRQTLGELRTWADRFIAEFKLDIRDISLCVERLPTGRNGYFRQSRHRFGPRAEISINSQFLLEQSPLWTLLGTLLHQLIHAWQEAHGTPGTCDHHNLEFRAKARELGLHVDRRGVTGFAANSPFKELLQKYGVSVPEHEIVASVERPRHDAKAENWSCGCTKVRVSVADFQAQSIKSGHPLKREVPSTLPEGNRATQDHNGELDLLTVAVIQEFHNQSIDLTDKKRTF